MPEPKILEVTMEQYLFIALAHAHAFLHQLGDAVPEEQQELICAAYHTARAIVPKPEGLEEEDTVFEMEIKEQHTPVVTLN